MTLTLAVQYTNTSHFDLHFNISSIHVGIEPLFMVYRTTCNKPNEDTACELWL